MVRAMAAIKNILIGSSLLALFHDHDHDHHGASAKNMNGNYKIGNSDRFDTEYQGEFFDVYSKPISTLYSEVHWMSHGNLPLPQDIVERFENGKVMAVTGYEVDQVMTDPDSGEDRSVPITWAYNHHYTAFLLNSNKAKMVKEKVTSETSRLGMNHGSDEMWMVKVFGVDDNDDDDDDESIIPQAQFFSEGNGGEMRKSYHGYPSKYAQLLESPDTFSVTPMQIDTWNRQMTNATYLPGPRPKTSRIPPQAGYNGLLECPCSDRLPKEWAMTYKLLSENDNDNDDDSDQQCEAPVQSATECFSATPQVVQSNHYRTKTVSEDSLPVGCSVSLQDDGSVDVVWNTDKTTNGDEDPWEEDHPNKNQDGTTVVGVALGVVNVTVSLAPVEAPDAVQLQLTGPADKWFGVGFGTDNMCLHMEADECPTGGPYAIIVSGDTVTERKLEYHGIGVVLSESLTVESNQVNDGIRTVHLSRTLQGGSDKHYTFNPTTTVVKVIMATGCSLEFEKHCGHGPNQLNMLPVNTPTKVCQAGIEGTIGGNKFSNERCAPFPTSDLLAQNNPTCFVQTYQGGLSCCRHGHFLLDEDQEIPWSNQPLEYRLKFRFYFEDYQKAAASTTSSASATKSLESSSASHQNLIRLYWTTEAHAGEYDIVQCQEGTPPSQCVQVITSRWKVRDFVSDCKIHDASYCSGKGSKDDFKTAGIKLIYAGPHCHAPACLSMELYNADTGRLLCRVQPIPGQSSEIFDERGFLALPPCLWGEDHEADGLMKTELLSLNTTLLSIKRNNNTLPHTGEMASWQMRGIVVPERQKEAASSAAINLDHDEPHQTLASRPLLRQTSTGEGSKD
jgi:hypothetical protein